MPTAFRPHDTATRVAMHALGFAAGGASDIRVAP